MAGFGNSDLYGGSGIFLVETDSNTKITGFNRFYRNSSDSEIPSVSTTWNHFQLSKDGHSAYLFGDYILESRKETQISYPIAVKVGSADSYGNIAYTYRIYNPYNETKNLSMLYGVHMDIGTTTKSTHRNSVMRTLGDNKGVYFESKSDDKLNDLTSDNGTYNNYYVEFKTTDEDGKQLGELATVDYARNPPKFNYRKTFPTPWTVFKTTDTYVIRYIKKKGIARGIFRQIPEQYFLMTTTQYIQLLMKII